uniref:GK21867 n=1 Tax=Drosophila willistoni TaxID=7260 RepID=B4MQG4_DROWI
MLKHDGHMDDTLCQVYFRPLDIENLAAIEICDFGVPADLQQYYRVEKKSLRALVQRIHEANRKYGSLGESRHISLSHMAEESNRVMTLALEANGNAANVIELLRGVSEGAVATLREQISFNREALLQFSEERKAKAETVGAGSNATGSSVRGSSDHGIRDPGAYYTGTGDIGTTESGCPFGTVSSTTDIQGACGYIPDIHKPEAHLCLVRT